MTYSSQEFYNLYQVILRENYYQVKKSVRGRLDLQAKLIEAFADKVVIQMKLSQMFKKENE